MNKKLLKELANMDVTKVGWEIGNQLRTCLCAPDIISGITAVAYVFYIAKTKGLDELVDPEKFIETEIEDKKIKRFIKNALAFGWEEMVPLYGKFDAKELEAYMLFDEGLMEKFGMDSTTPKGLRQLAYRLLDIQAGETVADFGTGAGSFIVDAYTECPEAVYYGNEINSGYEAIAYIRGKLLGENVTIVQEDMFEIDLKNRGFDKVFSNYPFGLRLRDLGEGLDYLNRIKNRFPDMTRATSSDWVFNSLLVGALNPKGKAIGIMTNGSSWNTMDKYLREYFIRKGLIECIIALPGRLFSNTSIPTTLMVFSEGNKHVRMIDAQALCTKGRRQNILEEENIEEILKGITKKTTYSRDVMLEEFINEEFVLSPIRYLQGEIKVENGVPFETVITRITRGAPSTASQLDSIISKEPTNIQYVMLSNIKGGTIDKNLPYLKTLEPKHEKYCLHNNDLVLSKNGYPFKVAVAQVEPGQNILASGNLYIIQLDEDKINPYYLKAYLESEMGIAALKSIAVGATIPNISLDQLKKMMIPLISLPEQNKIADKYLTLLDEISMLNMKISKATSAMKSIFDLEREE